MNMPTHEFDGGVNATACHHRENRAEGYGLECGKPSWAHPELLDPSGELVRAGDLKLGDVVQTYQGAFNSALVIEKKEHDGGIPCVVLFRPYATCSDVAYGHGVIPYTGTETFSVWSHQVVTRVQKGGVKQ